MHRTIPILLILVCATSFAQPVSSPTGVPVTAWWDGDPAPQDGVTHGTGFLSANGIWTLWGNQRWPSLPIYRPPSTFGACPITDGKEYLTGVQSSIIPIADPDNPQNISLYIFGYSPFRGDQPPDPSVTGAIRDPLGAVVRFWTGSYDAQQFLIYLSNGNLIGCTGATCNDYTWGNNFGGVVAGPEANPKKLYWFFVSDRNDVDHGRGGHLIGVSNPPVVFQRQNCNGGTLWEAKFFTDPCVQEPVTPAPTSTFQTNRWLDTSSPNYTILNKVTWPPGIGIVEKYNPDTQVRSDNEFTPVLARTARRPFKKNTGPGPGNECTPNDPWDLSTACQISRFTQITGTHRDGYFYLFIGLDTNSTISVRIPYDASQPNGLRRRPGTNAVDAEMWYVDAAHPDGAYQPIDTSQPISFSDDVADNYCNSLPPGTTCTYPSYCPNLPAGTPCLANANPPVKEENAILRDTGVRDPSGNRSGTAMMFPSAMVQYQTNVYWMTSGFLPFPQPELMHRFAYDGTNAQNPWSISTPFVINTIGNSPCPGCTVVGNYTMPAHYRDRGTVALYPLSQRKALGFVDVDSNDCDFQWGGGLLPFTLGEDTILNGVDFSTTAGCTLSVSPTSVANVASSGGSQVFTVTTAAGCKWTAATSYARQQGTGWLTLTNTSGTGSGTTTLTIAANGGGARTGYVNVAGRQMVVTQSAATSARGFYTMTPCRLLDTRNTVALQSGEIRNVQTSNQCGVASDALAVAVNVTVVSPVSSVGYVTAYPGPAFAPPPAVSTINYSAGRTLANNAVVLLGPDGTMNLYHAGADPLHFLVDVVGYFK